MFLSVFLAISVFAQCTPARSIWDSRVKSKGCSLNLTIIATVMCGTLNYFVMSFEVERTLLTSLY